MRCAIPTVVMLSCVAGTALAGPLDKKVVPASATWVLHVDVEAATASTIGKFVLAHREQADLDDLDDLKDKLGVDPITDVRALTVFGQTEEEKEAVLLIYGSTAFDAVLEKMTAENRVTTEEVEGYSILAWEEDGEAHVGYVRKGPAPDGRMVYIASDQDRLLAALKTLDGKAPSAAAGQSVLTSGPAPGSIVFIDAPEVSNVLAKARNHGLKDKGNEHLALLEKVRGVNIDLGEDARSLFATVTVTADTPENALNLVQTVQGFQALGRLIMSGEEDLAEAVSFLNAVKITSDDRRMLIRASWSSQKVQKLLEEAEQHDDDDADEDDGAPGKKQDKPKGAAPKKSEGV